MQTPLSEAPPIKKPRRTVRPVLSRSGTLLLVEIFPDHVTLRPKGARRGGPAEVVLDVGVLYQRGIIGTAGAPRSVKK